MADVPYAGGEAHAAPQTSVPDDYQHISSTPASFGGAIGTGLSTLGSGLNDLGQFYHKVATDDQINQVITNANHLRFGDPNGFQKDASGQPVLGDDGKPKPDLGFNGTVGQDALRARGGAESQLDQYIAQARKNLTSPDQQLEFDIQTRRLRSQWADDIGRHAESQSRVWYNEVNNSGAKLAADGIARNPDDANQLLHNSSDLIGFRMKEAQVKYGNALTPEIQQQVIADAKKEALQTQITAIGVNDPARAQQILEKNQNIAGASYATMMGPLRARADEQNGNAQGAAKIDAASKAPGASGLGLINVSYQGSLTQSAPGAPAPSDMYNYLLSHGASRNEALVLTGAAASESGLNPKATHDGGVGYGLFGHNGARLSAMTTMAGTNTPSWQQQAQFALKELRDRPEGAIVNSAKTAKELTNVQMKFERPQDFSDASPGAGHNYTGRYNTLMRFSQLGQAGGTSNADMGAGENFAMPNQSGLRHNWADGIDLSSDSSGPVSLNPLSAPVKVGLQNLHDTFGPFTVTSATGGGHAEGSEHYNGNAVDIRTRDLSDQQKTALIESARKAGFTGFGLGATHLHLDMRQSANGQPVVFDDAYNGPVAGKDIAGWQSHLSAISPSSGNAPNPNYFIGDSIANGYQTAAGGKGMTQTGASPQKVLDNIAGLNPADLAGKNIVLSGGASNDTANVGLVAQQIAALKAKGVDPANISVVGVGTRADFAGVNDKLAAIAAASGAHWTGPLEQGNLAADQVHPKEYATTLNKFSVAQQPQQGQLPPDNAHVSQMDRARQMVRDDPNMTDAVKNHALGFINTQDAQLTSERRVVSKMQQDDTESILQTGVPSLALTVDRVSNALGQDAGIEFATNRQISSNYYQKTHDFSSLSAQEIEGRVQLLNPTPGSLGFEYASKLQQQAAQIADTILKKRYDDPAGSVDAFPEVRASKATVGNEPSNFINVVNARLMAQARLGLPDGAQSPISNDEAKRYAAVLRPVSKGQADIQNQRETMTGVVKDINDRYGQYAQKAMAHVLYNLTMQHDAADQLADIIQKSHISNAPPEITREHALQIQMGRDAERVKSMAAPVAPTPPAPVATAPVTPQAAGAAVSQSAAQTNGAGYADALTLLRSNPEKYMIPFITSKKFGINAVPYDLWDKIPPNTMPKPKPPEEPQ